MKSIYVKKIGTIATGAVMLGAALSGAVGAGGVGDLNKEFFYDTDMSPKVTLVVGENAGASDGIAAANLAATIGNLAYATESTTVESDPVVCETPFGGDGAACVGTGSVTLSTTSTGFKGIIDQDERCGLANTSDEKEAGKYKYGYRNFYDDNGVFFDGGNETEIYSDEEGNFKEITTTEVCEARTDEKKIEVLLDKDYVNNQCFLCYDICQDTVTDLEHEMWEAILVDKDGVTYYEDGVADEDIDEELKMAVIGDSIGYMVYTDFLPPTFLKDDDNDLIDSRYRGKMIFLGDEYMVKEWDPDDGDGLLELAKGAERTLDNKAFGGDFTAGDGTYQFKVHRAIFSEDQVAGIIIDVKKPDGTEVQVVAQRSLNAIIGDDVEIYASNVATAGEFVQADVKLYDLSTKIELKNNEWYSDKEEWYVEMLSIPLRCLAKITLNEDNKKDWDCSGVDDEVIRLVDMLDVQDRFSDYGKVDEDYAEEEMLMAVSLTLREDYEDEDALSVGDNIMFPLDAFQFSYEGFRTDNFLEPRCSGDDKKIEIKKDGNHQVVMSFTDDNGDRYDDVHLDQGPIDEGDLFMVGGVVYELVDASPKSGNVEFKIKNKFDASEIKTTNGTKEFVDAHDLPINSDWNVEFHTFDDDTETDHSSNHYRANLSFPNMIVPASWDGSSMYLAQMPDADTPAYVGVSLNAEVGTISDFDIDDNALFINVVHENGNDLNGDNNSETGYLNAEDTLIRIQTECRMTECVDMDPDPDVCDCQPVTDAETVYIDFYDQSRGDDDHWANNVLVYGSDGELDDEDNADTLWLPVGGDEIVADYGSDDEIEGVTICHPRTRVYQTYFIGKGKNETKTTIDLTDADQGKLISDLGWTVESFGVSTSGTTGGGNATATTTEMNVTATATCDTHTIMPVGSLVKSDKDAVSGNKIVIGGKNANAKCDKAGICDGTGDSIVLDGDTLYVAAKEAPGTTSAVNEVIGWLKTYAHA